MKSITKLIELIKIQSKTKNWKSVGFIPTMGAIHEGHLSLVRQSKNENDITVVSIYVNPTQFNNRNDYENYPGDLEQDLALLTNAGVSYCLLPTYDELYSDQYRFRVNETDHSKIMEGKKRPGHFDGVLTVVMKLINAVKPHRMYMGEKDYQQYKLVKNMTDAFFMNTKIILCPTIRESDGLALSSRNERLSKQERGIAHQFYHQLLTNNPPDVITDELERKKFHVEYIEDHSGRRFGAVRLGKVRLIDNVVL